MVLSYGISSTLLLCRGQGQNGEAHFVGIASHELLADLGRILHKSLLRSRSVLDREGLAAIQLVQSTLLVHQCDEVVDHLLMIGGIRLALLSQGLMIGGELLVFFEGPSAFLRGQGSCLLQEVLQYSAVNVHSGERLHFVTYKEIRLLTILYRKNVTNSLFVVGHAVDQGDGSTGVVGELAHVEEILGMLLLHLLNPIVLLGAVLLILKMEPGWPG